MHRLFIMNKAELHIPFVTFLKIFAALLIGYCLWILWSFFLVIFLSILIAVTLHPAVTFLERRIPRWAAIAVVSVLLVAGLAGTVALLTPSLTNQITDISDKLPQLQKQVLDQLPVGGSLREFAEKSLRNLSKGGKWMEEIATAGMTAAGGLAGFILLLVLAIYFLVDGPRTYDWVLAYLSPQNRVKLEETAKDVSKVIVSYISGQFITSVLAALFVFAVLLSFKVPGALVLAVLAGVFDVLPVVGFFISFVPVCLFALTVSPQTALAVAALYVVYHAFENYFIVPKVYGNRLEVSGLVVLVTLIIAAEVAGVLGAIAVLPVVASYPIVERIWLAKYLRPEALKNHQGGKRAPYHPS
ncbi:AI-2E family transporter [bacterium]|nr:AI-2E family transporter [bacterium]